MEQRMLSPRAGYEFMVAMQQLSARDGHEWEAYRKSREYYDSQTMPTKLHELYATIIYRYARVAMTMESSRTVRALLLDYLSLIIPRPSRTHSLFLRLAIRVARKYSDFNFVRFFELWNPAKFRPEDISDPDGKLSLVAASFELVLDSDETDRLPQLLACMPGKPGTKLAIVREAFDQLINRQIQQGDTQRAIQLLEIYASHTALHAPDTFHSRLLGRALKIMIDGDVWRFVSFFIQWDYHNLVESDFLSTVGRDCQPVSALASRALKRCYQAVKADPERHAAYSNQLLEAFDYCLKKMPGDELLVRHRAMLQTLLGHDNSFTLEQMTLLAAEGNRSTAFWLDYAGVIPDHRLKLAVLSLAATQRRRGEKDDMRLSLALARQLHNQGNDEAAQTELSYYRNSCQSIAAEPTAGYGAIKNLLDSNAIPLYDNTLLYNKLAVEALRYIYNNIPSCSMSVLKVSDNLITAVSSSMPPILIDIVMWPELQHLTSGDSIEVKVKGTQLLLATPIPASAPYEALKERYVIVIGPCEVRPCHSATTIHLASTFPEGTVLTVKTYVDSDNCFRCIAPRPVDEVKAADYYDSCIAAIYTLSSDGAQYVVSKTMRGGTLARRLLPRGIAQGDIVKIYYYTNRHKDICPTKVTLLDKATTDCAALKQVSGKLAKDASGRLYVKDVAIDPAIVTNPAITENTYVTCRALLTPHNTWCALSVNTY